MAAVAALCARSLSDPPSAEELQGALFAPDQPAVVRGDPTIGVVATVGCDDGAHIRLLVVDPACRGRGHGHTLLRAAEDDARAAGHATVFTGADPPYFLWPGVPATATEALSLFERHHYVRAEANFNMTVELDAIPEDPGGYALATMAEHDEIDAWMTTHWSNWRPEVLRALSKGNLVVARDEEGGDVIAFCAFEVNRRGLLGPVAVRPDLMGRGLGRGVLLGALHELRQRGHRHIDVVWIGPVVPYAAVGGRVSEVYFVYRRSLG
jgi:predicted N-acetyltransferase YhbS